MLARHLLGLLLAAPLAAEPQLFVRNQPFSGPVRHFPTRTLAPLDSLLESLGWEWMVESGQLSVQAPGKGPSKGGPALREVLPIRLEGRPLRLEQHLQQDRIYVDIDQVAEAFQCQYRRSADGSTMDLYAPLLIQGLGEGCLRGSSEEPGFPIELRQLQMQRQDNNLRGFLRIHHRGNQPFHRVLVKVGVYERSGRLRARFAELVHQLSPGQEAVVQFPRLPLESAEEKLVTRVEFEVR